LPAWSGGARRPDIRLTDENEAEHAGPSARLTRFERGLISAERVRVESDQPA
jgi:hypothetical protein